MAPTYATKSRRKQLLTVFALFIGLAVMAGVAYLSAKGGVFETRSKAGTTTEAILRQWDFDNAATLAGLGFREQPAVKNGRLIIKKASSLDLGTYGVNTDEALQLPLTRDTKLQLSLSAANSSSSSLDLVVDFSTSVTSSSFAPLSLPVDGQLHEFTLTFPDSLSAQTLKSARLNFSPSDAEISFDWIRFTAPAN